MKDTDFEWDESKNLVNISKHGLSFDQAKEIFAYDHTIIPSIYSEEKRYIAIGKLQGIVFIAIIYTLRKGTIRIISARRAKKKEIELLNLSATK